MLIDTFPDFYFDGSNSQIIFNKGVSLRGKSSFTFNNNALIEIGSNTFFNKGCSINSLGQIHIGNNCLLGENVKLYDHNHQYKNQEVLIKDQGYSIGTITIGNNCWIGSNVIILKDVSIGDNCVIGANCIVYKNVPENSIIKTNAID